MTSQRRAPWSIIGLVALVAVTVYSYIRTREKPTAEPNTLLTSEPAGIMGTQTRLFVSVAKTQLQRGQEALAAAEQALRQIESLMSTWIDSSELSRLNTGLAGKEHALSEQSLEVIRTARSAHERTDGAFDVTCRPLIELWRKAAKEDRMPTPAERTKARDASKWSHFVIGDLGLTKSEPTARIDLGGIAKGYGIDVALEAMRAKGAVAGLVEVGGDLRFFGRPPGKKGWEVKLQDPFHTGSPGQLPQAMSTGNLVLRDAAVCTSGNYARYFEIQGQRLSHIIDPKSGLPAAQAVSVTVIAPTAMQADVWATALSVLSPTAGMAQLPKDVHALILTGPKENPTIQRSPGFPKLNQSR